MLVVTPSLPVVTCRGMLMPGGWCGTKQPAIVAAPVHGHTVAGLPNEPRATAAAVGPLHHSPVVLLCCCSSNMMAASP